MRATERRQALLEIICERRHEKMDNLAFELGVSRKTIIRDVLELSISYPIYTAAGRHESGVFVEDDYYLGKQYLSDEQQELLFDRSSKTVKPLAIVQKVERYNTAMQNAPARLYILYVSLYIDNNTQAVLAEEWQLTTDYMKELNNKLIYFLQSALK